MSESQNKHKLYYTIGEVAEIFDVNPSLIRYWEKEFSIIKPKKNKRGNRLFTQKDIDNIKLIYHLVKERGMTLDGAKKMLKTNKEEVDYKVEILTKLKNIKNILLEVKESLK